MTFFLIIKRVIIQVAVMFNAFFLIQTWNTFPEGLKKLELEWIRKKVYGVFSQPPVNDEEISKLVLEIDDLSNVEKNQVIEHDVLTRPSVLKKNMQLSCN